MSMRSPGFRSARARIALAHADLAGEHECLRTRARRDQPALDEQLVEPDAPGGARRGHALIVAHAAHPGLTATGIPS